MEVTLGQIVKALDDYHRQNGKLPTMLVVHGKLAKDVLAFRSMDYSEASRTFTLFGVRIKTNLVELISTID